MQYLPPCIRRMLGAPRISRRYIHYVTARHKKRQVIPLEETTNALSPEILRRYIGRTINLAKSELNVLLEEEACTNTLSIEQLGKIGNLIAGYFHGECFEQQKIYHSSNEATIEVYK